MIQKIHTFAKSFIRGTRIGKVFKRIPVKVMGELEHNFWRPAMLSSDLNMRGGYNEL